MVTIESSVCWEKDQREYRERGQDESQEEREERAWPTKNRAKVKNEQIDHVNKLTEQHSI